MDKVYRQMIDLRPATPAGHRALARAILAKRSATGLEVGVARLLRSLAT